MKSLYTFLLCASAHAIGPYSKVFTIAESFQDEFAMMGRVRGDGQMRQWKLEFRRPEVLLPHSAPVNATVMLFAENDIVLPLENVQKFRSAPEFSGDLPMRMSLAQGSDMANFNLNALLLPRGEKHILITNVESPYPFCREETVEFINLVRGNYMPLTVSLNGEGWSNFRAPASERHRETGVSLSGELKSSIPNYIFQAIYELVRNRGCSDMAIASFPRIEYRGQRSVYFMDPHEYVERVGNVCELKIQGSDSETTWGRTMIKKFAIMIDYRTPRHWICKPSEQAMHSKKLF